MAMARAYFDPYFQGLDALKFDRPALWVGNHTLYGLLDVPLMVEHIYTRHGVMLRGWAIVVISRCPAGASCWSMPEWSWARRSTAPH